MVSVIWDSFESIGNREIAQMMKQNQRTATAHFWIVWRHYPRRYKWDTLRISELHEITYALCFAFRRGKIAKRYNCRTHKIRKVFASVFAHHIQRTKRTATNPWQSVRKCMQCHKHHFASRCCIMCLVCAFEMLSRLLPWLHPISIHFTFHDETETAFSARIASSFPINARLFYVLCSIQFSSVRFVVFFFISFSNWVVCAFLTSYYRFYPSCNSCCACFQLKFHPT